MDTRNITRFFKGVAILFVFICHLHQTFDLPGELNNVFSFFQVGVQLFMLLSGMGLCFSYSKSPLNWLDFMKKRASKIVIFYWFAIALATIYRGVYALAMHKNVLQELNPLGIFINALLLHGLSSDGIINNQIVRGGWFVGTLFIFYALFPLMYRLYFKRNKIWAQIRVYLFPLSIFALTSIFVAIIKHFNFPYALEKLFLQLPPFCLGFPLFELQNNSAINHVKFPFCKGLVFCVFASVFYFSETAVKHFYIFSISIAFFYSIICVIKNQKICSAINGKSLVCAFFNAMGEYSFTIYLTHSYIAFDFCYIVTALLSRIYENDLLWFILLQPFVIFLSYFIGKFFNITINSIMSKSMRFRNSY